MPDSFEERSKKKIIEKKHIKIKSPAVLAAKWALPLWKVDTKA